jgi:predicted DNA-binding transcriptional regulator AlpA
MSERERHGMDELDDFCVYDYGDFGHDEEVLAIRQRVESMLNQNDEQLPMMIVAPTAIRALVERAQATAATGNSEPCDYKIKGERGLWLRVAASGTASWSLLYRAKGWPTLRRYGLGRFPDVTFEMARDAATRWRGLIGLGEDPRVILRERRAAEAAMDFCARGRKPEAVAQEEIIVPEEISEEVPEEIVELAEPPPRPGRRKVRAKQTPTAHADPLADSAVILTLAQFSELLGFDRSTVLRKERLGLLPPRRWVAGMNVFLTAEIRAWLAQAQLSKGSDPRRSARARAVDGLGRWRAAKGTGA